MSIAVWNPPRGRAGDVIPYVHDDVLHVFYLRTPVDDEAPNTTAWYHVATDDLVTWTDHGEAIGRGGADEQDPSVATGSVVQDDDGLFHAFTTGFSRYDGPDGPRNQAVLHATSTDLVTWVKDPGFWLGSDESRYDRHDWRDPFVWRDAEGWRMVLAGRHRLPGDATRGERRRSGLVVQLRSDDLLSWHEVEPLWDPGLFTMHECPDVFAMGDWWYLVYSTFDDRQVTRYRMARSPEGPWLAPQVVRGHGDDALDDDGLYAARTAGLRGRRLLVGWCPTRAGGEDSGDWQWGGSLVVHELVQRADGSLGTRLAGSGPDSEPVALTAGRGRWSVAGGGSWRVGCESGRATGSLGPVAPSGAVTISFQPEQPTARVGLRLIGRDEDYDVAVDLVRREVVLDRGSRAAWQRPLHLRPSAPRDDAATVLRAAWERDVVLVQVGDDDVLTARIHGGPPVRAEVFVEDGRGTLAVRAGEPAGDRRG